MQRIAVLVVSALAMTSCTREAPSEGGRSEPAVPAPNAPAEPVEPAAEPGTDAPAAPLEPPVSNEPPRNAAGVGACRLQDDQVLPPNALKAIGTEPFWAARIEGRCVTYSHPENQAGTRVWTRFTGSRDSGTWTGFYQNQRFVLRTRPQAGCSDGMSDKRYPLAVELTVAGEERRGCAEPL